MKKMVLLLLFALIFVLHGANPDLIKGVWYISVPENNGKVSNMEIAYQFMPNGEVKLVLPEKMKAVLEKRKADYKKRIGKNFPEQKITWSLNGNELKLQTRVQQKLGESVYIIGEYPDILMLKNKKSPFVLARKNAKISPEQAKRFFKAVADATRDTFADNLKLPENIKLAEPEKELCYIHFFKKSHWKASPAGSFQQHVLSAINKGEKLADNVKPGIPSLEKLLASQDGKEKLLQYFAANSEWRLYHEASGSLHAVRYFRYPNGKIAPSLHQYYSCFLPTDQSGKLSGDPTHRFQFRFEIGLYGKPWTAAPLSPDTETVRKGNDWHTRFFCGPALVNIFDQSLFPGRQMTKAALDRTEKEFSRLLAEKDWKKLLPLDSIRQGTPDLILRNSMQPGIYEAEVWCNPGEKGSIYLKAFEITKGTPLSASRLKRKSTCIPGWSDDPSEQFFSAMYFTIYEGEWNQFYGARFEVWFKPDSGKPERKLFEKNYKIQGWQR